MPSSSTAVRAVLVSGTSKGIGRAAALHLARRGFHVFAGVRTAADAEALGAAEPGRITPLMLDVTDGESINATVERIGAETDGLAGLVNNAAIVVAGPLEVLPLEEFRLQLEVNVTGALAVTQALLPHLRAARGRVVNVSSINGRVAVPYVGAYAASKFALEAASDALRMELRRWGIRVSVVEPGAIQTPIWKTATARAQRNVDALSADSQALYPRFVRGIAKKAGRPPRHALPPERVARVIHRALVSRWPRARYLVGVDARAGALLKAVLPAALMDRVLAR